MIVKRLLAALAAIGLIAGAWVVRERAIEGNTATADEPVNAGVLVCATELAAVCRTAATDGLRVVEQSAWATVDELAAPEAEPVLWLTFSPFPEVLNVERTIAFETPFSYTATELASSRLAAVVRPDTTAELAGACGVATGTVDLGCVGEQTQLTPAVSPVDGAIGMLSIAAAFATKLDDTPGLDAHLPWAIGFRRASGRVALTSGSAVQTIQAKPSVSVAIGAEAELANSRTADFDVLYADPVARATVVLVTPSGFASPDSLSDALGAALIARGWDAAGQGPTGSPPAEQMIAIRTFWEGLA
jgi:hypothetical protein